MYQIQRIRQLIDKVVIGMDCSTVITVQAVEHIADKEFAATIHSTAEPMQEIVLSTLVMKKAQSLGYILGIMYQNDDPDRKPRWYGQRNTGKDYKPGHGFKRWSLCAAYKEYKLHNDANLDPGQWNCVMEDLDTEWDLQHNWTVNGI